MNHLQFGKFIGSRETLITDYRKSLVRVLLPFNPSAPASKQGPGRQQVCRLVRGVEADLLARGLNPRRDVDGITNRPIN